MSVMLFSPEEFQDILDSYNSLRMDDGGPQPADVRAALHGAFVANRAAYAMTYQNDGRDNARRVYHLQLQSGEWKNDWSAVHLADKISSLLYNTIANSGLSYLPREYRNTLDSVRLVLYRRIARQ